MSESMFREGTAALAERYNYPTLTATGNFVADQTVKWLMTAVQDWHVYSRTQRHDPGWFHCSALGMSDEALIAQYRGVEGEIHSAQTLRIFDNGSSRDRDWKRYFKEAKVHVPRKKKRVVFPGLRLRGECDAIVADHRQNGIGTEIDDDPWIVEVKTMNAFAWGNLVEPKPDHRMQVESYMRGKRIPRGIVLYENKNTQALKLFRVDTDDDLWNGICSRLRRLRLEAEDADGIRRITATP